MADRPVSATRLRSVLPALLLWCLPAMAGDADVASLRLADTGLEVEVSPRLGGRMLHISLPGAPNLLKVGDAVRMQPDPRVDAQAEDIGYLGAQVWLGPQSHWWVHQQANADFIINSRR